MLGSQITRSIAQLKRALGEKELFALGRETGFEKRTRSITTLRFVTSLVQSLGSRRVESIAGSARISIHGSTRFIDAALATAHAKAGF
jgi:hypothetical protein